MTNLPTALDTAAYRRFIRLQQHSAAIAVARLVSRSGDGYLYAVFGVALLILESPQNLTVLKAGLIAFLIELPCFMGLKAIIRRDRPFVQLLLNNRSGRRAGNP